MRQPVFPRLTPLSHAAFRFHMHNPVHACASLDLCLLYLTFFFKFACELHCTRGLRVRTHLRIRVYTCVSYFTRVYAHERVRTVVYSRVR